MTNFIEMSSDNIIGISINGNLSDQELDDVYAVIVSKMQKYNKLKLYTEIEYFGGFSLESFFKDLKLLILNWENFEKEAIVTNWKWIQQFSKLSDKVFPKEQVQAFAFEEKEKAKEWIRE